MTCILGTDSHKCRPRWWPMCPTTNPSFLSKGACAGLVREMQRSYPCHCDTPTLPPIGVINKWELSCFGGGAAIQEVSKRSQYNPETAKAPPVRTPKSHNASRRTIAYFLWTYSRSASLGPTDKPNLALYTLPLLEVPNASHNFKDHRSVVHRSDRGLYAETE